VSFENETVIVLRSEFGEEGDDSARGQVSRLRRATKSLGRIRGSHGGGKVRSIWVACRLDV
jgi:hypothetical protein